YFDKLTTDLLHSVQIPAYAGGGTANRNIGEMSNKGIEAVIQATPLQTNDFSWDLSFNISSYKNKLLSLGLDSIIGGSSAAGSLTDGSPFIIQVGEPLGAFYGYEWQGIYTSNEADLAAIYKFMPGDNKYLDFNGDSIINGDDKHIIGYAAPKFIWALNNDLTYKNFELNIFIQGVHGRKVLNSTYASASTLLPDATSITHVDGKDFWTINNENATFANPFSSTTKKFLNSTQFLENASYIKVRNIALAYNIDKQVLKYFGLKLTLSAQNALTLTKYKGYDPEVSTTGGDMDGAMDIGAYPIARTISFGLTATF
ncbi:MAG: hypothetical protein JXR53_00535, partial [Bacteroidales bacterium]|nr:hypothetical protein [Bacteroidales bacterium]